jgi:hypothetical protein
MRYKTAIRIFFYFFFKWTHTGVPELAPQRKQACADNKRDSKLSKINFLLAQITEL